MSLKRNLRDLLRTQHDLKGIFDASEASCHCRDADQHGYEIKPAYGYRIDYKGRSVLISGDTRFGENLIRNGMNVDLLVHAIAGSKPDAPGDSSRP